MRPFTIFEIKKILYLFQFQFKRQLKASSDSQYSEYSPSSSPEAVLLSRVALGTRMDNVGTSLWTDSLFGDKIAKKYQRPVHRLRRDRLQLSVSGVCLSYRKLKGLCMMSPRFCCFKSILWVCHCWVLLLMHKMLCYRYEEDIKYMSPGRSNHNKFFGDVCRNGIYPRGTWTWNSLFQALR